MYGDHRDLHSFPTRRSSDLIRKIDAHTKPIKVNGKSRPITVSVCAQVTRFEEVAAGIFLPAVVEVDRSDSSFIDRTLFESVRVNEELDGDAFNVRFPAWCWVRDMDSKSTFIVDKKGGAMVSFSTPDEIDAWMMKNYGGSRPTASIGVVRIVFIVGTIIVAGVIVVVYSRRRRQHGVR